MSAPRSSRPAAAEDRLWVKICGVRRAEAVHAAVEAGADAVGFVLADSPRRLTLDEAAALIEATPAGVATVAVLHEPEGWLLREVVAQLQPDLVQVEVAAAERELVPAGRLLPVYHDGEDLLERLAAAPGGDGGSAPGVLLEGRGRGGRGLRPEWRRAAAAARRIRLVLAGGLTPENVAEAIRTVRPAGVDVSSGVESRPAWKDPERIAAFVRAARSAAEESAS